MVYGMRDLAGNLFGLRPAVAPLRRDEFWAVRDVSLNLKRGEVLGLLGVNGSGKTTLLRVLAGIFPPDAGEVTVRGRVGALIALGAGFHPHMTGRENIFLNGAILGVPREEIARRLDDIVEFSGVGDFLEAPVATYSSGMKVRLGYAIAARLSADIILIDEVLAVGDLAFRNKCFKNIASLLGSGRSFVLVSHNMVDVARSCTRAIVMKAGRIVHDGGVEQAIDLYRSEEESLSETDDALISDELRILGFRLNGQPWEQCRQTAARSDLHIEMAFECRTEIAGTTGVVHIETTGGQRVAAFHTDVDDFSMAGLRPGVHGLCLSLPRCPLLPGRYRFIFRLLRPGSRAMYARTAGRHELLILGGLPMGGCVELEHRWSWPDSPCTPVC